MVILVRFGSDDEGMREFFKWGRALREFLGVCGSSLDDVLQ